MQSWTPPYIALLSFEESWLLSVMNCFYDKLLYFVAFLVLRTICNELGIIKYKWFEIGVMLGIPRGKLMEFRKLDDPLAAAVDYWLNRNVENVPLSWRSIVKAVESSHVSETGLAKRISKKYCQKQSCAEDKGQSITITPPMMIS